MPLFDEVTMQVCLSGSCVMYGISNVKTFNCSTQNTEYKIRKQAIFVDSTSTFPFMKAGLEFHKRFFYETLVKLRSGYNFLSQGIRKKHEKIKNRSEILAPRWCPKVKGEKPQNC